MKRTCQFYSVGMTTDEENTTIDNCSLLAYDEYDSKGSGRYMTHDVFMCDRYTATEAVRVASDMEMSVFLVTITNDVDGETKTIEIGLMYDKEDAKKSHQEREAGMILS